MSADADRIGPATESNRRQERCVQGLLLLAALAVPAFGAVMTTGPSGEVSFAGAEAYPLPAVCPSRWLGLRCPTCGVTRSVIALMHGDAARSIASHRFGWLILALILTQIPYRAFRFLRPEFRLPGLAKVGYTALAVTATAVLLNRLLEVMAFR